MRRPTENDNGGDSFVSLVFGGRLMMLHVRAGGLAWVTSESFLTLADPLSTAVPRCYTCQRPITLGEHWAARTRRLSNKRRGRLRGRAMIMLI